MGRLPRLPKPPRLGRPHPRHRQGAGPRAGRHRQSSANTRPRRSSSWSSTSSATRRCSTTTPPPAKSRTTPNASWRPRPRPRPPARPGRSQAPRGRPLPRMEAARRRSPGPSPPRSCPASKWPNSSATSRWPATTSPGPRRPPALADELPPSGSAAPPSKPKGRRRRRAQGRPPARPRRRKTTSPPTTTCATSTSSSPSAAPCAPAWPARPATPPSTSKPPTPKADARLLHLQRQEREAIAAFEEKTAQLRAARDHRGPPGDPEVSRFRARLSEAGIAHRALAEIVEVTDPAWQGAVEAVLRPYRHVLLLAREQDRHAAWALGEAERFRHFIVPELETARRPPAARWPR